MRALVTGATGLIGSHIARRLSELGHDLRVLVRPTSRLDALSGLHFETFVGDVLRHDAALRGACADCDVVFHAATPFTYAGVARETLISTAVGGTKNVLAASVEVGVRRAVVTSSSVVFGYSDAAAFLDETGALVGSGGEPPYVQAKIAQHRLCLALAERLPIEVVIACPTMTLGPGATPLGPSNSIVLAYLSDPLRCTYPGGCNIVGARDVAAGHVLLSVEGTPGESYLLGSENLRWRELHAAIGELAGTGPALFELNHKAAYLAALAEELRARLAGRPPLSTRDQAGMIGRYYWYSHAKAARLGYRPAPGRTALVELMSWLFASPHVSRELRARLRLSNEVHRFRETNRRSTSEPIVR